MKAMDALDALAADLRERLLAGAGDPGDDGDVRGRIRALVDREAGVLAEDRRTELVARIAERAFGLGPLEPLLADPSVDEIMVSGTAPVWIERGGRLEATGVRFEREADLRDAIERILAPLGPRVDEAEPLADGRLPDRTVCTRQSLRSCHDDCPVPLASFPRRSRAPDRRLHPREPGGRPERRELHQPGHPASRNRGVGGRA